MDITGQRPQCAKTVSHTAGYLFQSNNRLNLYDKHLNELVLTSGVLFICLCTVGSPADLKTPMWMRFPLKMKCCSISTTWSFSRYEKEITLNYTRWLSYAVVNLNDSVVPFE